MSENDQYSSSRPRGPKDPWIDNAEISSTVKKKEIHDEHWEREMISKLAFAALNEQRRSRRWGIFFKLLIFLYVFAIIFYIPGQWSTENITAGKHTALIDIQGVIADNTQASADNIVTGLRAAFKDKDTVGLIMRINSPGGSPVQAGYVFDEVKRLKEKNPDIPVYAVVTDICASGGYYIAASADEIYADKASMVGSIGVLMNGFGFVEAMDKLGVERRLLTAGEHKGFLDPFSPIQERDVQHVKTMLGNIHEQFKTTVKKGRGERLSDHPDLFSGLIWTGEQSVELGLTDGLGSAGYVARELIKEEHIVNFTPRPNYLDRFAERIGVTMANVLGNQLQFK
jgi:protease-4